ncbi:MAG: acyl-CoA dehydrogenase [Tranquillimonas sp.]
MPYRAPVRDYLFLLEHVADYAAIAATDLFADASIDTAEAVLHEAARLSEDVIAPLQRQGDLHPARLENGAVRTSPGFAGAYRAVAEGGWVGMAADPAHGGMGLPLSLATLVNEMMAGACLSFQLNPLMTQGQIDALSLHASDEIRAVYLPRLISGEWCGTMNLTEAQAGSDVGALATRAVPADDGSFRITGEKIFITWGDNDFAENICHLVLARLPDAPEGTRGISLFLVPKRLPDAQGRAGVGNAVTVAGLEHKLGMHGSPTCTMRYDGATGWMIGAPNKGMAAMFTMMNNARLGVGMQAVGVAEAAQQLAADYAGIRRQGRAGGTGTIAEHADVRRMLLTMRAETQAARAVAVMCAAALDMHRATGNPDWAARAALLTPIAKAYGTETGMAVSDMGVQVHGGMGYIEETGATQFFRDVRVTAIYEGTNGIQAMDLVNRKLADGGEAAGRLLDDIEKGAEIARPQLPDLAREVWRAAEGLRETTEWLVARNDPEDRNAGAAPYLRAFARVLGAHAHLRCALAAGAGSTPHALADFYIRRLLPEHAALLAHARAGREGLYLLDTADLVA